MNRILDRGSGPHTYPTKREKVCATQDMLRENILKTFTKEIYRSYINALRVQRFDLFVK